MYQLKTRATDVDVVAYLDGIADPVRRADCDRLLVIMARVTGCPPRMWGPSIVGFGQYHYRYESGHEGDMCLTGFANRKSEIVAYVLMGEDDAETQALLARIGKYRRGKSCLYLRSLAGVDLGALEQLVAHSVARTRARYPD